VTAAAPEVVLPTRITTVLDLADFDRWCYDERSLSANSRRCYLGYVRRSHRWLAGQGRPPLAEATLADLRAVVAAQVRSAPTRNMLRKGLVVYFDWLVATGARGDNLARELARVRVRQGVPKALSRDQAHAVLRAARVQGAQVEAIVAVMLYAGLRNSEARHLTWQALEGDARWIRFTGKGSKERVVPLHRRARGALARWYPDCPHDRLVFPSPTYQDRPVTSETLSRWVAAVGHRAGVPGLTPHVARHSYATRLVELGVDLRTVQEALGHASLATTQVYTRVRPERLTAAVASLDF